MNETPDLLHVAHPMRCNVQQHPVAGARAQLATQATTPLKSLALKVLARSRACNDRSTKDGKSVQQRAELTLPVVAPNGALVSALAELNGLLARLARSARTLAFDHAIADEVAARSVEEAVRRIHALTGTAPGSGLAILSHVEDRITCRQCARRIGALCGVDATEKLIDQLRRCRSFEPRPEEQDQRPGRERWTWLQEVDGRCANATSLGATETP